jgi:hypothetical protein
MPARCCMVSPEVGPARELPMSLTGCCLFSPHAGLARFFDCSPCWSDDSHCIAVHQPQNPSICSNHERMLAFREFPPPNNLSNHHKPFFTILPLERLRGALLPSFLACLHIQFKAAPTGSSGAAQMYVYGEDVDDSASLSNAPGNLVNRWVSSATLGW